MSSAEDIAAAAMRGGEYDDGARYDAEYGADTGFWTTEMFVEAVYRTIHDK